VLLVPNLPRILMTLIKS